MSAGQSRAIAALGAVGVALSGSAVAAAQAREALGTYAVGRPVFAPAAPAGWPGQATDSLAAKRNVPNRVFAGYSTTRSEATDFVARFKVPGVACSQQETAIGPGAFVLAGAPSRTSFNSANIIVGCISGQATAQEAIDVNGVESDFVRPVQPGDVIIARLTDNPNGRIVVRLRNLNPQRRFVLSRSGRGSVPAAELAGDWASIDANTGARVPPPDFEDTTFRGVSLDGHPISVASPTSFNMATSSKVLQITTSPLTGPARDTFTCRRRLPR